MLFTLPELFDMIVMTAAVGYLFMDSFKQVGQHLRQHASQAFATAEDIMAYYAKPSFDWDAFKLACLVAGPALLLHELGHKFVALAFGLQATFQAAYQFLFLGLLLKVLGVGLVFFVPAYVEVVGATTPAISSLVSFAGPGVNLLLAGFAWGLLRFGRTSHKERMIWTIVLRLNLILFGFNMLPIPLFDGFKVYAGLWEIAKVSFGF